MAPVALAIALCLMHFPERDYLPLFAGRARIRQHGLDRIDRRGRTNVSRQ